MLTSARGAWPFSHAGRGHLAEGLTRTPGVHADRAPSLSLSAGSFPARLTPSCVNVSGSPSARWPRRSAGLHRCRALRLSLRGWSIVLSLLRGAKISTASVRVKRVRAPAPVPPPITHQRLAREYDPARAARLKAPEAIDHDKRRNEIERVMTRVGNWNERSPRPRSGPWSAPRCAQAHARRPRPRTAQCARADGVGAGGGGAHRWNLISGPEPLVRSSIKSRCTLVSMRYVC